ncbi:hypothetical protein [Agrobacterium tumefaciens]|uniref:hypothetical protein n=1 Tax=Agrobacterium tumefaciens TaxID=358 RepID=UPI0015741125|nr:hypothetical protein [Agrobacterium tumefaciens]WCK04257.1 hypothetical protein G6L31_016590 [Agrobacterium tumefaciens]
MRLGEELLFAKLLMKLNFLELRWPARLFRASCFGRNVFPENEYVARRRKMSAAVFGNKKPGRIAGFW